MKIRTSFPTRLLCVMVAAFATVALTFGAAGAAAAATPAHRDTPAKPTSVVYAFALKNQNTGRCIDDSWGYGLRAFGCNGLNYQELNFYWQSDGSWVMQDQNTGRCIDDSWGYGLRAFGCNYLSYQKWKIIYGADSTATFQNENTGRCIDDSWGYGLRAFGCNYLSYQRWSFQ